MALQLKIAYKGTAYCGWQVQKNATSVQSTLQEAIETTFGTQIRLTGCSRTDAGVHARGFVCKVDGLPDTIPETCLPEALCKALPPDISVWEAKRVPEDFHPRYDAKGKHYSYTVRNSRVADPFTREVSALWYLPIEETQVDALCARFCGTHDFRAFMAAGSKIEDTVRTLTRFSCTRTGETVRFDLCANGFLYNMARILVGTVLDLHSGVLKETPETILASGDRKRAGRTMPACGLCLEEVFY